MSTQAKIQEYKEIRTLLNEKGWKIDERHFDQGFVLIEKEDKIILSYYTIL